MDTFALLILILLFLSPGFLFLKVYHSRKISVSHSGSIESPFTFISQALFATIVIHILFSTLLSDLSILTRIPYVTNVFSYAITFELKGAYNALTDVIIYSFGLDEISEQSQCYLQSAWRRLFLHDRELYMYNFWVIILSVLLAILIRKKVMEYNYDLKYPFLRYPNPYYYFFTGKNPQLKENGFGERYLLFNNSPYDFLEVTVRLNDNKSTIIKGILGHYTLNKKGYDNIVIYHPVWIQVYGVNGNGINDNDQWRAIPVEHSDYMLIEGSEILTISIKPLATTYS